MRLVIGISGASGVIMGYELLRQLREMSDVETHLVVTNGARETFAQETGLTQTDVCDLADAVYDNADMTAAIASGSYATDGMIIIPCSMKTVAGIVSGYADNLLLRAADVTLKEQRRLVIVPREMPLSRIHLRNLSQAADYGCLIVPPMLTFYNHADTVAKQVDHIIGKVLRPFGIDSSRFVPWKA